MSFQHHSIQDLAKEYLIPIVNVEVKETDMANKIPLKLNAIKEDNNYNINEGRSLNNFSKKYSEWCEENDFNEYENSEQ
ncbi:12274_t:CDS:2 [Cetraspora pellucida]|uniref:12274_t:CDS:1 n=1 Tax=Cetraspora pellucida TaxID=1433469 RepID=A0ACA9NM72_9GLOM|nr:12274_t:CDS:2 [Cetraspora pellucida]